MSKKEKTVGTASEATPEVTHESTPETPVEVKVSKNASPEKIAFAKLIEAYAKQNPVKYAGKKKALEAKLATL